MNTVLETPVEVENTLVPNEAQVADKEDALIGDAIDPKSANVPRGRQGYQAFSNLVLERIKDLAKVLEPDEARL